MPTATLCVLQCDTSLWLQGLYAAMGMAGIAAADNGKTEYAANISADLVRLGWGVLVSSCVFRTTQSLKCRLLVQTAV